MKTYLDDGKIKVRSMISEDAHVRILCRRGLELIQRRL
jgi:hypothetical protein